MISIIVGKVVEIKVTTFLISVNHRFVILRSQRSSGDEESLVISAETLRSQRTLAQSDIEIVIY